MAFRLALSAAPVAAVVALPIASTRWSRVLAAAAARATGLAAFALQEVAAAVCPHQ